MYNGRLRSELVLRGEVGLPYAGAPKYHLRGFRLRETPTVEKSPPNQLFAEKTHDQNVQRQTR